MGEEWTVSQAAAYLDVTPHALRELIHRGRLPARRIGPIFVVQRRDVETYRAERGDRGRPGPRPARSRSGEAGA